MNQWDELRQHADRGTAPAPSGGQGLAGETVMRINHATDAKGERWWIEPAAPGATQAVFRLNLDGSTYLEVIGPNQGTPAWVVSSDALGNGTFTLHDTIGSVTVTAAQLRALLAGTAPPVVPVAATMTAP